MGSVSVFALRHSVCSWTLNYTAGQVWNPRLLQLYECEAMEAWTTAILWGRSGRNDLTWDVFGSSVARTQWWIVYMGYKYYSKGFGLSHYLFIQLRKTGERGVRNAFVVGDLG